MYTDGLGLMLKLIAFFHVASESRISLILYCLHQSWNLESNDTMLISPNRFFLPSTLLWPYAPKIAFCNKQKLVNDHLFAILIKINYRKHLIILVFFQIYYWIFWVTIKFRKNFISVIIKIKQPLGSKNLLNRTILAPFSRKKSPFNCDSLAEKITFNGEPLMWVWKVGW